MLNASWDASQWHNIKKIDGSMPFTQFWILCIQLEFIFDVQQFCWNIEHVNLRAPLQVCMAR